MKRVLVSGVAALALLNSGLALAWTDVSGTIKSIDTKDRSVTLDDGKTYSMQKGVSITKLEVGDKVTVSAETQKGKNVANKITKG